MFLIFNVAGLAMIILGMIVMYGLWWLVYLISGDSRYLMFVSVMAGLVATIIADLAYRALGDRQTGWLRFLYPSTGGSLFFLPVWLLGVLMGGRFLYSLIEALS